MRKKQIGVTHQKGKRLRSVGGMPLFKVSANAYRDMKAPKPSVYASKTKGTKHSYVLYDRRKRPSKQKQ